MHAWLGRIVTASLLEALVYTVLMEPTRVCQTRVYLQTAIHFTIVVITQFIRDLVPEVTHA